MGTILKTPGMKPSTPTIIYVHLCVYMYMYIYIYTYIYMTLHERALTMAHRRTLKPPNPQNRNWHTATLAAEAPPRGPAASSPRGG